MPHGVDVAYVRISKDLNLERLGTARQEQDCRELAARRGLSDPLVIADDDTSAYALKRKRPGWSRLLEMIEQNEVRTLLSYASDRLYRRLTELESLITLLEAHPVEILTVTSGDIDLATADGRMLARFLGSVSQNSSEKSAERIIRAHRAIAEAGRWKGGGPRPLGYEADGITVREEEAAVVREAAAFILAGGSTVKAACWLSERLERNFTAASLGKTLRSPHIAGHRLHVPQAQRDAWEQRRAAGEVVGDQPTHALVTHTRRGTWQPVLDEETWRLLLGHYRAPGSSARPRRSLLAGLLRCSECGHLLGWGESKAVTATGRFATYRCVSTTGGCGRISIAAEPIEAYVVELLRGALAHASPMIDRITPRPNRLDASARRQVLEARLDELADAYGAGELSRAQHLRLREKLQAELGQSENDGAIVLNQDEVRATGMQVVAKWDAAATEERNTAARILISSIWIYPVGRGGRVLPIHRMAVVWKDDLRDLTARELRAEVAPPPAQLTHEERLAIRAAAARVKRRRARDQEAQ